MKNTDNLFLILVWLVIVSGCSQKKNASTEETTYPAETNELRLSPEQVKANDLVLGHPEMYTFSRKVSAIGYLEALPENKRKVSVRMGGTIRNLKLMHGEYVKAGQQLFIIENPGFLELQEEYLSARENLRFQKDDLERQKHLAGENAASLKTLQKAEADYKSTLARVNALKSKLQLIFISPEALTPENIRATTVVPAPISGYITRKNGENGQYVSDQTEILEIVQTEPLILNLSVFEKDILLVKEGQMVHFSIPDMTGEVFKARVMKAGKQLNENRTVTITAFFDSRKSPVQLIPGMYVKAEIITGEYNALSLPATALVDFEDQYFVLVKTNSESENWVLAKTAVKIGYQDGERVEILPGSELNPGSDVVVKGAFGIANN